MTADEISAGLLVFIILATLWTLPWKGYALWKAAQRRQKWWFIIMLVLNDLAILEILYIFVFSKRKAKELRTNVTPPPQTTVSA